MLEISWLADQLLASKECALWSLLRRAYMDTKFVSEAVNYEVTPTIAENQESTPDNDRWPPEKYGRAVETDPVPQSPLHLHRIQKNLTQQKLVSLFH